LKKSHGFVASFRLTGPLRNGKQPGIYLVEGWLNAI
jgi:hypothetical protein